MNTPKYKGLGFCSVTLYFNKHDIHISIPTNDDKFIEFMKELEKTKSGLFNEMVKWMEKVNALL